MSKVVSINTFKLKRDENIYIDFYKKYFDSLSHSQLLDLLLDQFSNSFPGRSSTDFKQRAKHKALVKALEQKAVTNLFKEIISEFA